MAKAYKGAKPKVAVDPGHGGTDAGAVKYLREEDVNLTMGLACRDFLELHDVAIWMSRTKDVDTDLNKMCRDINAWGADLAISVHNNAGGGDGFEVYHSLVGGKGRALAKNIESEVKEIGQNSRGLKTRRSTKFPGQDYYGFIRMTKCPAVICEGVFVDNKTDVQIADTLAEQRLFGYAYAKGALKTLGIKEKPVYETTSSMNFRDAASLDSKVLATIPEGTVLTGVVDSNGWLKTTYKGKTGYVRAKGQKTYCKKV